MGMCVTVACGRVMLYVHEMCTYEYWNTWYMSERGGLVFSICWVVKSVWCFVTIVGVCVVGVEKR